MEHDNNNHEQYQYQDQENEYMEENLGDDEDEFMFIYRWVDTINLSRPKKNISRDFSDGGKKLKKKFIFSSYCRNFQKLLSKIS
jgi:hypothetical protein